MKEVRLYCLRISDQILKLGNGGVKKIDKALAEAQKKGTVRIEKNLITDIESATFTI